MVVAKPLPRPVFTGLLILAALVAVAALSVGSALPVLAPTLGVHQPTQVKPRANTTIDPRGPVQPVPSSRSGSSAQPGQGTEQAPTGAGQGITRFADGPTVVVAPASQQGLQTCGPRCPPKPA